MAGRSKKRSLKPVEVGPVTIKLYQLGDGRIGFWDHFGGPRKFRVRRTETEARGEAEKMAIRCMNGQAFRDEMTTVDVQAYQNALQQLEPLQMELSIAISEYAAIKKMADGKDLIPLMRSGIKLAAVPEITVNGLVEELLARKRRMGVKFYRMHELEGTLKKFIEAGFGNRVVSTISTKELDVYLDGRKVGPRRRNNVRACLVTLWRFAKKPGGYVPEPLGETAAELTEKANEGKGVITIYSPAEMRFWLEHISEDFLPWLAAVSFSGVRTEEVIANHRNEKDQLRWEDFRWTKGYINIRPEVSKTGERRMCPLLPNLISWLEPYKPKTGYVVAPGSRPDNELRRLNQLSAKLTIEHEAGRAIHPVPGLAWKRNAHRHSYGSYRMAIIKNMPQLEYEMGNSRTMIKRHYHDAREEDEATEYFGIYRGERPANLVDLVREGAVATCSQTGVIIVPESCHTDRAASMN